MTVNNFDRAAWAKAALDAFSNECMPGGVVEEALFDLISDLGHYAELSAGFPTDKIIKLYANAIGAWMAESESPNDEPENNYAVEIIVKRQDGK